MSKRTERTRLATYRSCINCQSTGQRTIRDSSGTAIDVICTRCGASVAKRVSVIQPGDSTRFADINPVRAAASDDDRIEFDTAIASYGECVWGWAWSWEVFYEFANANPPVIKLATEFVQLGAKPFLLKYRGDECFGIGAEQYNAIATKVIALREATGASDCGCSGGERQDNDDSGNVPHHDGTP